MGKASLRAREFCVLLPCWVCPQGAAPIVSDPDHRPPRSRGGDDRSIWPLCHRHHVEIHAIGEETFCRKYGLPPDGIKLATEFVAVHFVKVFGATSVFDPEWPDGQPRLEEVRKEVINQYLATPLP